MAAEVLQDRQLIGRKPHQCTLCLLTIEKGERHVMQVVVDAGLFWTNREHLRCSANYWAFWRWATEDEDIGLADIDPESDRVDDALFRDFLAATYKDHTTEKDTTP